MVAVARARRGGDASEHASRPTCAAGAATRRRSGGQGKAARGTPRRDPTKRDLGNGLCKHPNVAIWLLASTLKSVRTSVRAVENVVICNEHRNFAVVFNRYWKLIEEATAELDFLSCRIRLALFPQYYFPAA